MGGSASTRRKPDTNQNDTRRDGLLRNERTNGDGWTRLDESVCSPRANGKHHAWTCTGAEARMMSFRNTGISCPRCREMGVYYNSTHGPDDVDYYSKCTQCDTPHCAQHASYYHRKNMI